MKKFLTTKIHNIYVLLCYRPLLNEPKPSNPKSHILTYWDSEKHGNLCFYAENALLLFPNYTLHPPILSYFTFNNFPISKTQKHMTLRNFLYSFRFYPRVLTSFPFEGMEKLRGTTEGGSGSGDAEIDVSIARLFGGEIS